MSVQIRRKMREIMVNQATACDLKELVRKFIPEMIGKEIEKATSSIYPLQNVFIRKVKILKAPKFDLGKLMEVCPFCWSFCLLFFFPWIYFHLVHDGRTSFKYSAKHYLNYLCISGIAELVYSKVFLTHAIPYLL